MLHPLKSIIIGAGLFGTKRLRACLDMPRDFTVVGIIDSSDAQRKNIQKQFHIPTYSSLSEMKETADFAIVATPNAYHADMTISALKKGMHVLCEKPLAPTQKEAQRIETASKRYNKFVKTGSNHRFFHTVQKAKELYDRGAIGKLLHFKSSIGINGQRVSGKWFWDPEMSGGGSFIDNGCHLLDIARMFMGNFVSCHAHMANVYWKKSPVEDMGTAIYVTRDNRQAIIMSSWIQWAGYLHIELWGEKGYIIVDSTGRDTVTLGGKTGIFTTYDYSNEPKNSYHRELLYMKQCILSGTTPTPSAKDGTAVIGMIQSAYTSSRTKSWSHIPT